MVRYPLRLAALTLVASSAVHAFDWDLGKVVPEFLSNIQVPSCPAHVATRPDALSQISATLECLGLPNPETVAAQVNDLTEHVKLVVQHASALMPSYTGDKGQTFERDILAAFGLLSEELQKLFPPPEKAQGHAERVASLTAILDKVGQVIVGVLVQHGVDEDETREKWVQFESVVLDVFVLMEDLAEQHPIISSMILSVVMYEIAGIPQGAGALFARSLLRLFGLGPAGPTKNSLAAWAQSLFFGPAISKGSWFAKLQKISMTPAKL